MEKINETKGVFMTCNYCPPGHAYCIICTKQNTSSLAQQAQQYGISQIQATQYGLSQSFPAAIIKDFELFIKYAHLDDEEIIKLFFKERQEIMTAANEEANSLIKAANEEANSLIEAAKQAQEYKKKMFYEWCAKYKKQLTEERLNKLRPFL